MLPDRLAPPRDWLARATPVLTPPHDWLARASAVLAPPACWSCRAPVAAGQPLCPRCRAEVRFLRGVRCPWCGLAVPCGRRCPAAGRALERAWAPVAFEGPA
ncbi:MAG TPA: double zinc ribbon domain-containing protein, partial [Solirubrobacteraceae bacterium]